MKIISWNLYNLFDGEEFFKLGLFENLNEAKNFVDRRVQYFANEIKKQDVDIAYFYEVVSGPTLERIAKEVFGEEYFIFGTTPDRRGSYNAVLSKRPLASSEVFISDLEIPLFDISEEGMRNKYLVQKRGYIKSTINDLNIYAVHLKSQLPSNIKTVNGEDYEIKNSIEEARAQILGELIGLAESYAIRKIISEDISLGKGVIMIGDYNADTYSRRLKVLRGKRDAEDEMKDLFNVKGPDNFSYIHMESKVRLDHLLASVNIFDKIVNPEMHTELVNVTREMVSVDTTVTGSDHAAFTFEVNI